MEKFDDEKIIKQLKDSLDYLNDNTEVQTPNIEKFREMVSFAEKEKEKKDKKELYIFISSAIILLTFEIIAFRQSFVFFIGLQGLATSSLLIFCLQRLLVNKRKVKAI